MGYYFNAFLEVHDSASGRTAFDTLTTIMVTSVPVQTLASGTAVDSVICTRLGPKGTQGRRAVRAIRDEIDASQRLSANELAALQERKLSEGLPVEANMCCFTAEM